MNNGKIYEVTRSTSGQIGVLIHEANSKDAKLLVHCKLHSPTGMETGYSGSGPADLAASILADYLGIDPKKVEQFYRHAFSMPEGMLETRVVKLHQPFKEHFIAPKHLEVGQSYLIAGPAIEQWISQQGAHQ